MALIDVAKSRIQRCLTKWGTGLAYFNPAAGPSVGPIPAALRRESGTGPQGGDFVVVDRRPRIEFLIDDLGGRLPEMGETFTMPGPEVYTVRGLQDYETGDLTGVAIVERTA